MDDSHAETNKSHNTHMEISGKIIAALEPRGGVSQRTGNTWKSQEFVIETHEQYPKRCVFRVFGEDRLRDFNIQVGEELTVSFDIDAHEYNGKWFNSVNAWKVEPAQAQQQAAQKQAELSPRTSIPPQQSTPAPVANSNPAPSNSSSTDLPF